MFRISFKNKFNWDVRTLLPDLSLLVLALSKDGDLLVVGGVLLGSSSQSISAKKMCFLRTSNPPDETLPSLSMESYF